MVIFLIVLFHAVLEEISVISPEGLLEVQGKISFGDHFLINGQLRESALRDKFNRPIDN